MDHNNLFIFRRLLYITTIVVVSLKPVLSVNSQFNACQPQKCGENVSVEYPFWISSHQPSSCGNPSLEINCADGKPTIWFSGDTYVILNISYENQSLLLADADAFDDKACVAPRNNVTLSQDMSLSPYDFHLYFFYDCTVFPTHYPTFPIPCLAPKRNSHNFAALLHGSTLKFLNASSEKCESFVAAPVYIDEGVDPGTLDGMNYTNILQKGFLLNWSLSSSCNECRQSGGLCGHIENQFMCFCHDHNHTRSCDHGKFIRDFCFNQFSKVQILLRGLRFNSQLGKCSVCSCRGRGSCRSLIVLLLESNSKSFSISDSV